MAAQGSMSEKLKAALENGVLKRLPFTFLPFANQQLREWDFLFPNEHQSVERLLLYVTSLSASESAALFRNVIVLEERMGVREWKFSTTEQTIENASLLARSRYYQDWRSAVQAVFDAADQYAQTTGSARAVGNRLVLLDIPRPLELSPNDPWRRWQKIGRPIHFDGSTTNESSGLLERLLAPDSEDHNPTGNSLLSHSSSNSGNQQSDTWVIDAGRSLVDALIARPPSAPEITQPILLSYLRLNNYRENFSREMNSMRKDLADADAVYDRLRKVDVQAWCPPEADNPAVREYLRALYLSGNGAVIFGNSFVQWGASEAFRRARPRMLIAKFGVRSKPKPFTGVAVFDNPDQVNPLPAVDDLPGSAADAQILALYVWLAAIRYGEYQNSTVCICLAESISQAYLIAPPDFPVAGKMDSLTIVELRRGIREWMG